MRPARRDVTVAAGSTVDVTLAPRTDASGHTCTTTGEYRAGDERLPLTGRFAAREEPLPFPVTVYGTAFDRAWITTDGVVAFGSAPRNDWGDPEPDPVWVEPLPRFDPDLALYPFHSLMDVDAEAGVHVARSADAFVVEWRNVRVLKVGGDPGGRLSVSATLHRDGRFTFAYRGVDPGVWTAGRNAVVGVTDPAADAFVYGNLEPVVRDGLAVTIHPPGAR